MPVALEMRITNSSWTEVLELGVEESPVPELTGVETPVSEGVETELSGVETEEEGVEEVAGLLHPANVKVNNPASASRDFLVFIYGFPFSLVFFEYGLKEVDQAVVVEEVDYI